MASLTTGDGIELFLHEWTIPSPRLLVIVLHGYGEHAGRYAHMAQAFNAKGMSVLAVDLRGHGKSKGRRGHVERFRDYHHDVYALMEAAKSKAPGVPIALFGHSMGALLGIDWLLSGNGKELVGVALSSPFLGIALAVNPVKAAVGRFMSRYVPTLALPTGIHGTDVTRDPELSRLYDSDPLNNKNATARWFTEALETIERAHARAAELAPPMLLLYGGADRLASADATDRFAARLKERAGKAPLIVERLGGYFHELVNEPPELRAPVIERFAAWLIERAEAKAA